MKGKYRLYCDKIGREFDIDLPIDGLFSAYHNLSIKAGYKISMKCLEVLLGGLAGRKYAFGNLDMEEGSDGELIFNDIGDIKLFISSYDDWDWLEPLLLHVKESVSGVEDFRVSYDYYGDYPNGVCLSTCGYDFCLSIKVADISESDIQRKQFNGFVVCNLKDGVSL